MFIFSQGGDDDDEEEDDVTATVVTGNGNHSDNEEAADADENFDVLTNGDEEEEVDAELHDFLNEDPWEVDPDDVRMPVH